MCFAKIKLNPKHLALMFMCVCVIQTASSQFQKETRIDDEFPTPVAFPTEYYGEYAGNLRVSNQTGVINNIPVEFNFKAGEVKGTSNYTITYFIGQKKEVQEHIITPVSVDIGLYSIKTGKDNLIFNGNLIDQTLYSTFEIENNIMTTEIQFDNTQKIRFKIVMAAKVKKNKKTKDNDAKPANVILIQKGVFSLKR